VEDELKARRDGKKAAAGSVEVHERLALSLRNK
jgi:hypothetical protein